MFLERRRVNPAFEKYDSVAPHIQHLLTEKKHTGEAVFKLGRQEEARKEFAHVLREVLLRSGLGPAGPTAVPLDLMIALTALRALVLSVSWISDVCGLLLLLFAAKGLLSSK